MQTRNPLYSISSTKYFDFDCTSFDRYVPVDDIEAGVLEVVSVGNVPNASALKKSQKDLFIYYLL